MRSGAQDEAYLKLYDEQADSVFRFAYFKLLDRDRAEEVTQEAFVRTWEYLQAGKPVENLRAFVYRVANNIIVDQFRKKRELSLDALRDEGFDAGFEPLVGTDLQMDVAAVRKVIDSLDAKYRDAVLLRHVNGISVKEIAVILGVSENVASVRIHRGIEKLRLLMPEDASGRKKEHFESDTQ